MKELPPISDDLRTKISALDHEVTMLHFKWIYFLQLFGKKHRVATFNKVAGSAFQMIQTAMLNDLLLAITRLCGPAVSAGKRTLSFRGIAQSIPDAKIRAKIEDAETKLRQVTESVRVLRNEKLAYNSLDRKMSGIAVPTIQMAALKEALRLTAESMNILNRHYFDSMTGYEHAVPDLADGSALWFHLQYGLECWTEDRERGEMTRARKIRDLD